MTAPVELERKFLVTHLPELADAHAEDNLQDYLTDPGDSSEIRLRQKASRFFLTTKIGHGLARIEREAEISRSAYVELWPGTRERRIEKTRWTGRLTGGLVYELDVFDDVLSGLSVVEVEFSKIEKATIYEPPDWFGREVTEDGRYSNAFLARNDLLEGAQFIHNRSPIAWRSSEIGSRPKLKIEMECKKMTKIETVPGVGPALAKALSERGITSLEQLATASVETLQDIPRVGPRRASELRESAAQLAVSNPEQVAGKSANLTAGNPAQKDRVAPTIDKKASKKRHEGLVEGREISAPAIDETGSSVLATSTADAEEAEAWTGPVDKGANTEPVIEKPKIPARSKKAAGRIQKGKKKKASKKTEKEPAENKAKSKAEKKKAAEKKGKKEAKSKNAKKSENDGAKGKKKKSKVK